MFFLCNHKDVSHDQFSNVAEKLLNYLSTEKDCACGIKIKIEDIYVCTKCKKNEVCENCKKDHGLEHSPHWNVFCKDCIIKKVKFLITIYYLLNYDIYFLFIFQAEEWREKNTRDTRTAAIMLDKNKKLKK